ncbi:ADAMTS-like protein 1 isoform X2 [Cyprinodon tularosa]|uniref:ADAMTS-like protein 1 isoform X2 n=1 Tax=Cyprinodon tularosa TaxID=77115 RepID=UPI0018E1DEEA|nr:ADAMTS-like protein 1 isoform X2 [Cyprinodon tularosa]
MMTWSSLWTAGLLLLAVCVKVAVWANDGDAVFIREYTLIRRDHLSEEPLPGGGHKPEDASSRTARSEEDKDTLWDAWGSWSECSRTCGGGASYSLRRCLSSRTCEGQNIKYRTCSNVDCPPDAGDFRAQQCSAHADVRYQGHFHDWLPVYNDPENPCSLKCKAKDSGLVVELAPKVLDGTRCYTESLDMCISGVCQIVGCDHELGSTAKEDNCGICNGDGSSCRLVRGHYKSQHASGKTEDTVVIIPYQSRHIRLVLKGTDHLYVECKTLQGVKTELMLDQSGHYYLENTTLDFQKFSDKEILRMSGPLGADFTIKIQFSGGANSVIQYIYYQPIIHRWRETDFFPCSVTCGGGYQLTSAECYDLRTSRVVVDQYCHYYPENVKPKPKLQECNMEPCLDSDSDGYKEIMPYDLYHPLPRWESSPWTACSTSCGGGLQSRSVTCVEEDMQGNITPTEEWKCLYSSKTAILQPCNTFSCPTWVAQEWSPCTVTCGQGLRYRVVLCIDHRGLHAGGCNPTTKPHIKEECLVTVPCYKSIDTLPIEAKPVWQKQAIELEEEEKVTATQEPTFIPGPWQACSKTCGAGTQHRTVKCQVLLSFSQTVADLPDDECDGEKPASVQSCYSQSCSEGLGHGNENKEEREPQRGGDELDWEYEGFTECSETCGGGVQEAMIICLNKQSREAADQTLCASSRRPPPLLLECNTHPCPPRWETGEWSLCSATCGVGLMTRTVTCIHRPSSESNYSAVLKDELCQKPKPSLFQACNRFDCPPTWDTQDWSQCSQTCGGGFQKRKVFCKQRMADGSILELPDTFCPSMTLLSERPCGKHDCPPQWVTGEWSQCSVTCGHGIQTLQAVCRRQRENGLYEMINSTHCLMTAHPIRFRSCFLKHCEDSTENDGTILAKRKVYIQWRKSKRVQLAVGGYAYLMPWSTLIIHCPTFNIRKGHIQWLKEGKPLVNHPRYSIKSQGFLRIHQVHPTDAGIYTCTAGSARENFVLHILGNKKKLAVPESWLVESGQQKTRHPDTTSTTGTLQELPIPLNKYDNLVEHLIEVKGYYHNKKYLTEKPYPSEKNKLTLEGERTKLETSVPAVLVTDSTKLDEIMQNLSEGFRGHQGEHFLMQFLLELAMAQGSSNDSTIDTPDGTESFTNEPVLQKPNLKIHTSRAWSPAPKNGTEAYLSEVIVNVGAPVFLQKPVSSLELRCQNIRDPRTSLMWTKNGNPLHLDGRVNVLASGSLRIQSPGKEDEGLYTCTFKNRQRSTSLSSWLRITSSNGGSCFHGRSTDQACVEKTNSSQSAELCRGQSCPFSWVRWQADAWLPCSASCGGGSQSRTVRCMMGHEGDLREVQSRHCLGKGKKPSTTRLCKILPCARWVTGFWGLCRGRCVGPSLAKQHRHIQCKDTNGTKVSYRMCHGLRRPSSVQNCSTDACSLYWHVGPWKQCTATCGRHGFQSRQVTCRHRGTGRATRAHHCMWTPRPSGWQRCNMPSCGREACRDSTRYCELVRQLELCPMPQFKSRCCHSCMKT